MPASALSPEKDIEKYPDSTTPSIQTFVSTPTKVTGCYFTTDSSSDGLAHPTKYGVDVPHILSPGRF